MVRRLKNPAYEQSLSSQYWSYLLEFQQDLKVAFTYL